MKLENEVNVTNSKQELVTEKEQNKFLDSTLGKVVDSAIDVGLRMVLPDFIEEGVIGVKDALLQEGLKEGIDTAVSSAVDLGKSILGIFTGKFDNVSQARDAVKSGGIIDEISGVLETVIDKTNSKGLINNNVAYLLNKGKNAILDSVTNKIEDEFTRQIDATDKLAKYEENWKQYFENKDFAGMEREYSKIREKLKELLPIENTIKEARIIENLHTLIKKNGQDFNLSLEQMELAKMLS